MENSEGMEELLLKYIRGNASVEEVALVEEWMEASEENRKLARQVQLLDWAVDIARISTKVNVESSLADIHNRIGQWKKENRYEAIFRRMQRAAAILFIPLVVSWCILYFGSDSQRTEMLEIKTNPGMTTSVELPDGTVVVLNSSSLLQYPSRFSGKERKVKLIGEAFFSVTKDSEKPFVVDALNNSKIKVYGTEFNIEAYEESKTVQTTLVSGKVSFDYLEGGKRKNLMMRPGQKVIYNIAQNKVIVKKANVDVETCWKDGRLIFKDTPFEDVLKSLSKRYNVTFVLKNTALKRNSFTATFTKQRLERILEIFRISSNIQFKFVDDGDTDTERQVIEVY